MATDLRGADNLYRIPGREPLPSVTTILDTFFARGQEASAYYVALRAKEITERAMAKERMKVWERTGSLPGGDYELAVKEVSVAHLLLDTEKLANVWRAELRRRGDIGTAVHVVVSQWADGLPVYTSNAKDYTEQAIVENCLTCSVDDAAPYAQSAVAWLENFGVDPMASETTVFDDREANPYAGTFDLLAKIDGVPWLLDFKTSVMAHKSHVYQVSAYKHAPYFWNALTREVEKMPKVPYCAVVKCSATNAMFRPVVSSYKAARVFRRFANLYQVVQAGKVSTILGTINGLSMKEPAMRKYLEEAGLDV